MENIMIQKEGVGKTLIAYVTKSGVTEESAKIIADVLHSKYGFDVDLINLVKKPSPDLTQYKNIFIGSGIRMQKWYRRALGFLKNDFEDKKVVVFLSSCEAGDPKSHQQAVTKYITNVLAKYPHIKPLVAESFGGRIRMFGKINIDNYDMEKVRAWAEEVGKKLIDRG